VYVLISIQDDKKELKKKYFVYDAETRTSIAGGDSVIYDKKTLATGVNGCE